MKLSKQESGFVWKMLRHVAAAGSMFRPVDSKYFEADPASDPGARDFRINLDWAWSDGDIIRKYCSAAMLTPMEKKFLLRWKKQALPGLYTVLEITDEDAIVLGPDDPESPDARFWRVCPLVSDWEEMIAYRTPPVTFVAALLPFGDRIICDGAVGVADTKYGEAVIRGMYERYRLAKEIGTIRSSFPPYSASASTRRTGGIKTKRKGKRK